MEVVNLDQVHSFTEGGSGETWRGWRQVKKLRNQVKHPNYVSTFSTLIFSESSWSEDEVQAKVGKLELNSYELHNTVTGGFRFELSRLIFTTVLWNSTPLSSITPLLVDSGFPVQDSGHKSCSRILVSTFVTFQGRVFLSPYSSTTAVSPTASTSSPGCKMNLVLMFHLPRRMK